MIDWLAEATDFVEDVGLDAKMVESVVENPQRVEMDPRTSVVGYDVKRLKRGDIEVVVGYSDPENPMILFVRLLGPAEGWSGGRGAKGGTGGAGKGPSTVTDMVKRAQALGYTVEYSTHIKLMWDGKFAMAIPRTPSDYRSLVNSWHQLLRDHKTRTENTDA